MRNLREILQTYVSGGLVQGAVGLVARGGRVEVQAVGCADADGTCPMARDSIFRIASITKPITAPAAMMLVEDGRIALEDPVGSWLPELASPVVVRSPAGPAGELDRFTSYYRAHPAGGLELVDAPGGQWSRRPAFPSGAGGLVSTADDWHCFARMLLADGSAGGRQLLPPGSVRQMTTNQLTPSQRDASRLILEGQGWGFGGSVDVEPIDPWNIPGRYGWVGGTGTAAHITPSTGTITILLSQLEMAGPTPPALMRDFWRHAASA